MSAVLPAHELQADLGLPSSRVRLARRALVTALVLGVLADLLLRRSPVGLGLLVWALNLALLVVELVWRRGKALGAEGALWLLTALLFAASTTWRAAEGLLFFDFLAFLAALGLLGMVVAGAPARAVIGARVRDLVWSAAGAVRDAIGGVLPLAFRDAEPGTLGGRGGSAPPAVLVRTAVLTLPLLLVFGALLRSADPVFAKLVAFPEFDVETVLSHVLLTGFFTWVAGGWLRGMLLAPDRPVPPERLPLPLGAFELAVALLAVDVLFAAFVGVQLGWLFGGDALVKQTTGLSYAQYARHGFFELTWVSILVLPLLLVSRMLLPEGDTASIRRWRRLAGVMLALVGAIMLSALGRMELYVRFYGLSTDRVYATTFMLWLAVVFLWFAATMLRERPRAFAGGMVLSGFGMLLLLNAANPEQLVARVNLARTPQATDDWRAVDLRYLAGMSGDAVPMVVDRLLAPPLAPVGSPARVGEVTARCEATRMLLDRWAEFHESPDRHWTTWSFGKARAGRVVAANAPALRQVGCLVHGSTTLEEPFHRHRIEEQRRLLQAQRRARLGQPTVP